MISHHRPAADAEARLGRRLENLRDRPALRTAIAFATTLAGGLALMLLFFALIGEIDPTRAVGLTVAMIVLLVVWLVAVWSRRARPDQRRIDWRDRERRGF